MKSKLQTYKAFVSSTFEDLKDHWAHVIHQLRRAGFHVDPMEDWPADSAEPKQFAQERLEGCDVCLLLVALRRGYVPEGETRSITQLEYEAALKQDMNIFPFLLEENGPWWRNFDELDKDPELKIWRNELTKKHKVEFFSLKPHSIEIGGAMGRWLAKQTGQPETPTSKRIDWPEDKSPYPGLEWFDAEYAPLYFGRDREVDDVIAKMSKPHGRFLLISGASGSGKSSLVSAGLWKGLIKDGGLPGSKKWRWLRLTPGGDGRGPFAALASGLKQIFPKLVAPADDLATALAKDFSAFKNQVTPQMIEGQELLLVIDQLEELFTLGYPSEEVQSFLTYLVAMSRQTQNRCRIVATIRSDFLGRLAESEAVLQRINEGFHHLVGPIATTALLDMIQKPAQATDYAFEENLINTILNDAGNEPGNLPLVAYTLKQLFEHRRGDRTFTDAAYQEMRGVLGAIGAKADQVLEALGEEASQSFDHVFAELVHIDRDRPPTRKRVPLALFQDDPNTKHLIEKLSGKDCRILVTGEVGEEGTVEVAHEQLFTTWQKLTRWITTNRDALHLIEHAAEGARQWSERGEMPEDLGSASRADEVLSALNRFKKVPSPELDRFLRPQEILVSKLHQGLLSHKERATIGWKISDFKDLRPGIGLGPDDLPDISWVEIPGGQIQFKRAHWPIEIKPFRLAKYPVTNVQFESFFMPRMAFEIKNGGKI